MYLIKANYDYIFIFEAQVLDLPFNIDLEHGVLELVLVVNNIELFLNLLVRDIVNLTKSEMIRQRSAKRSCRIKKKGAFFKLNNQGIVHRESNYNFF